MKWSICGLMNIEKPQWMIWHHFNLLMMGIGCKTFIYFIHFNEKKEEKKHKKENLIEFLSSL